MVGFEPTYRLPDKRISSAPRYDHFDTSPCKKSSYNRILLNAIRSVDRSDMERFWSDIFSEQCRNNLANAYIIESCSRGQKLTIAFRVRPVMTTSIHLRAFVPSYFILNRLKIQSSIGFVLLPRFSHAELIGFSI